MQHNKKLILMCGAAGSGKSTWLQVHEPWFDESHIIVSRDAIRYSYLKEGEDYFAHEKEVWRDFVAKIKDGLNKVNEVYVDATHLNERNRAKLFRALGKDLQNVILEAVYFDIPLEQIIKQNDNRTGRAWVPPAEIAKMRNAMTEPSFEEGFHKVYVIHTDGMIIKERD